MTATPILPCIDPGTMFAELPAMLRHTPTTTAATHVLILFTRHPLGYEVSRVIVHVPATEHPNAPAALERLTYLLCAERKPDTVLLLIINHEIEAPTPGQHARLPEPFTELPAALETALTGKSIPFSGAFAAAQIAPSAPWWSLTGQPRTGPQTDPEDGAFSFLRGVRANIAQAVRDDVTRLLSTHRATADAVTKELPHAETRAHARALTARENGLTPTEHLRNEYNYLRFQIRALPRTEEPLGAHVLARLAVSLREADIRREVYRRIISRPTDLDGCPDWAEVVFWATLTTALTGPDRGTAAGMLAVTTYLECAHLLAAEALEITTAEAPDHPLAPALAFSFEIGARPDHIREMVASGLTGPNRF